MKGDSMVMSLSVTSQLQWCLARHFVFSLFLLFHGFKKRFLLFFSWSPHYPLQRLVFAFLCSLFSPLSHILSPPLVPVPFISPFLHINLNGCYCSYTSSHLPHQQSFLGPKSTLVSIHLSSPSPCQSRGLKDVFHSESSG